MERNGKKRKEKKKRKKEKITIVANTQYHIVHVHAVCILYTAGTAAMACTATVYM